METTAIASQSNMEDALEDLEALMIKWKDMVKLAQDLNERLTAVSAPTPTPAGVILLFLAVRGCVTLYTRCPAQALGPRRPQPHACVSRHSTAFVVSAPSSHSCVLPALSTFSRAMEGRWRV